MSCGSSNSNSSGGMFSGLFGSSTEAAQPAQPAQSGGSRRRKHSTRRRRSSGSRKTRSRGCKRACRCPGGCKRSTCPCCKGSKSCCTKRCRSRGCRCKH